MAKKNKAAKADEVTAARVDAFNAGQRDRLIRLIEDLQTEREALRTQLTNEREINRRLSDAIANDLVLNPYYVSLQRRHQTVMGMLGQTRENLKTYNNDKSYTHPGEATPYSGMFELPLKWINEIIDVDSLAQ